ncbi:MAG: hypothetical protein ACOY94_18670 [Bacillota bacterium]
MGRRRKRLIVQADLTSEEDQAFLAWVEEKRQRRRLAEEIREGLRFRYQVGTGQAALAYPSYSRQAESVRQHPMDGPAQQEEPQRTSSKLQKLVQSF